MAFLGKLVAYTSLRDVHGNCYTALKYIDLKTHKEAFGTVSGGEDNVRCAVLYLAKEPDEVHLNIAS